MTRWTLGAILVAAGFPFAASPLPAGDWPQWRYDAARSAAAPDELPDELHLQWMRQLPPPRPAWPASQPSLRFDESYTPVAAANTLYVPSMVTDSVTAYDLPTGRETWRFFAEGPVRFAPIVHHGNVYFASDDGYLYCLDAADGQLRWRYRVAPTDRRVLGNERLISSWPIRGAPVLHDGKIFCAAGIWCFMGVFVRAIDAETGRCVWTNSGDGAVYQPQPHSSAVSFGGFVPRGYLGVRDHRLAAPGGRTPPGYYDLDTGQLVEFNWDKKGGRAWQIYGDPRKLTAGTKQVQAANGVVTVGAWQGRFEGEPWSLLAADQKLVIVTTAGRIYCFGAEKETPVEYGPTAQPVERGKDVGTTPPRVFDSQGRLPQAVWQAAREAEGYGLMLGLPSAETAERLVRNSTMHWIVVDPDAKRIDAFRHRMTGAGLYGTRVAALAGDITGGALPPYLASLVVATGPPEADGGRMPSLVRNLFRVLRPYGGSALVNAESELIGGYAHQAGLANAQIAPAGDGWSLLVRRGALPSAADWTHNYANAANTGVSGDRLVRAPLGILWFGNGPPNDEVLPRHGHGPAPQVAAGRLFLEGPDMLRSLDIYTGRLLWQRQFTGLGEFYSRTGHQPGAGEIGSNYVSLADSVYVVRGPRILRLDAATGQTLREFSLPQDKPGTACEGSYLAAWDDVLVAGALPVGVTGEGFVPQRYASASKRLVAMDRRDGRVLWTCDAEYNFRHNNIAIAAGKVFCIDGLSKAKLDRLTRRGRSSDAYRPRLLALDAHTGRVIWSTSQDVFGTFLNYSTEYDVLLQAGSSARDRAPDETTQGMVAYRGADGAVLWKNLALSHQGPCLLLGDRIIAQGPAYSLLTGQPVSRPHPLTSQPIPWRYTRTYGCNTAVAGQHLITFRSGAAGYCDVAGGGTGNLGGFKSSCTSNLIVAGGLLNAPEYTRTCTCNYQNQTSLALVHDPRAETWTFNDIRWDGTPVRRVGINFGAPGDRRADDGTLWLDYPSVGGPSPDIPVAVEPSGVRTFRQHSALVRVPVGRAGYGWVAASGIEGVRRVTLTLAQGAARSRAYTVRLHFAEMRDVKPGQRVFRVAVQGQRPSHEIDIAKRVGPRAALVTEFTGVEVTDQLSITFTPASGDAEAMPLLCGIEVAEQPGPDAPRRN